MKEGWEYKKLGEVCDFEGGSQPPKSEWINHPQNGYIRMLQIRDFTKSRNAEIEYVKITKKLRLCKDDDILIGRYGASVGKILTGLAGAYNVAIIKSIPNEELIKKDFIRRYFESPLFQSILFKVCTSRAAQAGFSKDDIKDELIPLPPLSEQQRIVDYLDSAFAKIDAMKANAEKALNEAKALFQASLKEMLEPKEGWEENKLVSLTSKIGSGATPKGGRKVYIEKGCHLIRSMNIQYNEFKYEDLAHITDDAADQLKSVEIQENDVLFNITGASIARCCVVPDDVLPARVNQHVSILRIKQGVLPRFLSYLLNSPEHQKELLKIGEAGSTRQALTKTDLENHLIAYPNVNIQSKILYTLDSLKSKVDRLQSNFEKISQECDALKQAILRQVFE